MGQTHRTKAKDMEQFIDLLIFLIIIGSAILVHEWGHFMIGRRLGIKMLEFGFGLPPRILKLGQWRETEITLNWIPLGGFVRPEGMYDTGKPDGLVAAHPLRKSAFLLAGAASNVLLALLLFAGAFMLGGPAEGKIRVVDVSPGSPAYEAGLLAEDVIVGVVGFEPEAAGQVSEIIRANIGRELTLEVERDGELVTVTLVPRTVYPEGQGPAGFATLVAIERHTLPQALLKAGSQLIGIVRDTVLSLAQVLIGAVRGEETMRIVGPVGLKQAADWTLEQSKRWDSTYPLLYFSGLINIGIGITNLLPLPALDGGRLVFVIYEIFTRRRFWPRIERRIQGAGAIALLISMVLLSINDVLDPLF
jgi:regulator of sigma E protease